MTRFFDEICHDELVAHHVVSGCLPPEDEMSAFFDRVYLIVARRIGEAAAQARRDECYRWLKRVEKSCRN